MQSRHSRNFITALSAEQHAIARIRCVSEKDVPKFVMRHLDCTLITVNAPEMFVLPHSLILSFRRLQDLLYVGAVRANVLLDILKMAQQRLLAPRYTITQA